MSNHKAEVASLYDDYQSLSWWKKFFFPHALQDALIDWNKNRHDISKINAIAQAYLNPSAWGRFIMKWYTCLNSFSGTSLIKEFTSLDVRSVQPISKALVSLANGSRPNHPSSAAGTPDPSISASAPFFVSDREREFNNLYGHYLFANTWPWQKRNQERWAVCSPRVRERVGKAMNTVYDQLNKSIFKTTFLGQEYNDLAEYLNEWNEMQQWIFDAIVSGQEHPQIIAQEINDLCRYKLLCLEHIKVVVQSRSTRFIAKALNSLFESKILPNESSALKIAIYELLEHSPESGDNLGLKVTLFLHSKQLLTVTNIGLMMQIFKPFMPIDHKQVLDTVFAQMDESTSSKKLESIIEETLQSTLLHVELENPDYYLDLPPKREASELFGTPLDTLTASPVGVLSL